MNVYFSDYFNVSVADLDDFGAFNISLINDLPVFIDPFLLFNSDKDKYKKLHENIIKYIRFLREMSESGIISQGLMRHWFLFPEVKQNWLGYSKVGNSGAGLGPKFGAALNNNLATIFNEFGSEQITKGSHLEKLCLVKEGVGKDNISDFTTNLVKGYLCDYTQEFGTKYLGSDSVKSVNVPHANFDYVTRRWLSKKYQLPYIDGDFVLLTPKDILTKDEAWINKHDVFGKFDEIIEAIPNIELRGQINDYFLRQLPIEPTRRELDDGIAHTLRKYPALIDYYIRLKEDAGKDAVALSEQKLKETEAIFIRQVSSLVKELNKQGEFYQKQGDTLEEAYKRIEFLKHVIENCDGYRLFYIKGKPVKREADLQLMFRLTWYASEDDVNSEVNNGRGPVDYKISRGSRDKTLVEFKLASNSKLKQNLEKQLEVYEAANQTNKSIKVILYFSEAELQKVLSIMNDLGLKEGGTLVLIDAQSDNKPSGSNAN